MCAILMQYLRRCPYFRGRREEPDPTKMLWALHFLYCYNKEEINAALAGVDEKTWRKWVKRYVLGLYSINAVSRCFLLLLVLYRCYF